MKSKDEKQGGPGSGIAGLLILIEIVFAFIFGMTVLDNLGSESLRAIKFSNIGAGVLGVLAYFILHIIPGLRWIMMAAMILLWAFAAYSIGLMAIGDDQERFHLVAHKGPYIGAAIAGLFRAFMYR